MSWLLRAILVACCACVFLARSASSQPNGLMVTAPRVWLSGSQEKVCIVSRAFTLEVQCNISLVTQNEQTIVQEELILPPGGSSCMEVSVPSSISDSSAKVKVSAVSTDNEKTYSFSKSADVTIKKVTKMTIIQTNKPVYKPGDLVRIRMMTLKGPNLKIVTNVVPLAYVEDPTKTRVMQWINVSSIHGLSSLDMQLSDEPRLGEWTIKAEIDGETKSQKFTVEEYVLPKYEVIIHHPSYIFIGAPKVTWKVCARYTYGQPVQGSAESSAFLQDDYLPGPIESNRSHHKKLVDGCAEFSVNFSSIKTNNFMHRKSLNIHAEVKERGTGVKLNSTLTVKISHAAVGVKFLPEDSSSSNFKPGFPYHGKGRVSRPDGSPAKGMVVRVQTDARKDQVNNGKITSFPVLDLTTDGDGMFSYILPGTFTSQDINSIYQFANVLEVNQELLSPKASKTLKAWYSPSYSFLQIEPFEKIASCHSLLSLPVMFVSGIQLASPLTFYFQVVTRGDIVHNEKLSASLSDRNLSNAGKTLYNFNITFAVTPRISGSPKILVFTILPDGETVADSQMILVEDCLQNHVSMRFTDKQKQPGYSTKLKLSADPHSLCSVSVVDKSVKLMDNGDSSISKSKVFGILKQYDISPSPNYHTDEKNCGHVHQEVIHNDPWYTHRHHKRAIFFPGHIQSEYVDSKKAFLDSGMIVLSDLKVVSRPCLRRVHHRWEYQTIMANSGARFRGPQPRAHPQMRVQQMIPAMPVHLPVESRDENKKEKSTDCDSALIPLLCVHG